MVATRSISICYLNPKHSIQGVEPDNCPKCGSRMVVIEKTRRVIAQHPRSDKVRQFYLVGQLVDGDLLYVNGVPSRSEALEMTISVGHKRIMLRTHPDDVTFIATAKECLQRAKRLSIPPQCCVWLQPEEGTYWIGDMNSIVDTYL